MSAVPEELVQKATEAVAVHRWKSMGVSSVACECGDILYGDEGLTQFPADQKFREHIATAALEAIGLPALLERVEAAEFVESEGEHANDRAAEHFDKWQAALAERDALAAKVALLTEQVTYLERSRDNICETAERDRGDALRGSASLRRAGTSLLALKDGPRDAAYYAAKKGAWDDLRAALTEGTETP